MCPFRITWCIAPEGDPGEVRARDREGLGPPVCCHDQGLEEPPLSIRNSLVSESNPRCARDPGHIRALGRGSLPVPLWRSFLISPNGPWCLLPGLRPLAVSISPAP